MPKMSGPSVIALGFYDGATEGLARDADGAVVYFRLLAWDKFQDDRLFAIANIEPAVFDELVSLLGSRVASAIWVPDWEFSSLERRSAADEIVEACRRKLGESKWLIQANNILNQDRKEYTIRLGAETRFREALESDCIGRLEELIGDLVASDKPNPDAES